MTGGAFRNNSNLLGRKRELEELQKGIAKTREMFGITDLSVDWRIDPMKTYEGEALPDGIIDADGANGMGTKSV